MKSSHYANIDNSKRLQRGLRYLKTAKIATSRAIQKATNTTSVSRLIDEIRKNGHLIDCAYGGRSASNAKIYYYHYLRAL